MGCEPSAADVCEVAAAAAAAALAVPRTNVCLIGAFFAATLTYIQEIAVLDACKDRCTALGLNWASRSARSSSLERSVLYLMSELN